MIDKNQTRAYKFALIAVLMWSTVATAFKITLLHLEPFELLFYASLSSLFILGFLVIYQKKLALTLEYAKHHWALIILLGLINPCIYYLILFEAYDLLPAQVAQAINYTWALVFSYLGVFFLGYKLKLADIMAGFICYFGVLIIATRGEPFSLHFSDLYGVFLALASTVLWSIYWILNARVKVDGVIGLFCNFFVGVVALSIVALFGALLSLPDFQGLLGSIYIGFFEMGVTFVFWLKAVNLSENISKTSNLIFLSPFVSLAFIHFFVGEEILLSTLVALGFILAGLLVQKRWNR